MGSPHISSVLCWLFALETSLLWVQLQPFPHTLLALHCICNPLKDPHFSEANPNQSLNLYCMVRDMDEEGGGNGKVAAYPASQVLSHWVYHSLHLTAPERKGQWGGVKVRWDFLSHTCASVLLTPGEWADYVSTLTCWRANAVAQLCFVIRLNLENNFYPCIWLMS